MKRANWPGILALGITLVLIIGCATYYQKNTEFQKYITRGEFEKANNWLENESKDKKRERNKILYYLNKGFVYFMMNSHEKSNGYFHDAEDLIDEQEKEVGKQALSYILNPSFTNYIPEDFETVMLHYFTAMNYIKLRDWEDALVECRRINLKLNQLNDKYKDHKNRYQRDAFAHNLMGMIYDVTHDYNNAFIAYRNAYEIYQEDYKKYFDLAAPQQLKRDLLRAAHRTGFDEELRYYEKKFDIDYKPPDKERPELIFFWLTGYGPVKSQWEITFTKGSYKNGYITFLNSRYDLSYRFYVGDRSDNVRNGFKKMEVFRVAFPKYLERPPVYTASELSHNGKVYKTEKAQDINKIAFKTLRDRMLRVFANSLLRVATKKALQMVANEQDENLGTLVSIANAVSEKADTRNWQTLPYAIHYTRIPLHKGKNTVELRAQSKKEGQQKQQFTIKADEGNRTYFRYFHHLESYPPNQ